MRASTRRDALKKNSLSYNIRPCFSLIDGHPRRAPLALATSPQSADGSAIGLNFTALWRDRTHLAPPKGLAA